jgi:acyl CoA:acetate/3-ketoacid CoA transferase
VAPGLDIRTDVLDTLSCEVVVADQVSQMPASCFAAGPMGLRAQWLASLNRSDDTTDHRHE